jgi:hypothetical protein
MSLRPALYGWKIQEFIDVIGSKNVKVQKAALGHLREVYESPGDQAELRKARAWLRTLINKGYPLRRDRKPPIVRADGELLLMRMETGIHVAVVNSLVQALRRDEFVQPLFDRWSQGVSSAIHNELRACGLFGSRASSVEFITALSRLDGGTALFGDGFHTGWEYYSVIEKAQIGLLLAGFEAVLNFERKLPDGIPAEAKKRLRTRVSADARGLITELIDWFGKIERAGQDAFILWS